MEPVLTLALAAAGSATTAVLVRTGRRLAVADRATRLASARRRLPSVVRRPLAAALRGSGFALSPEQAVQYWLLATCAAASCAAFVDPVLVPPSVLGAMFGTRLLLRAGRVRNSRRRAVALPDALESVANELRAGGTIPGAVDTLARSDSPLAGDLSIVAFRTRLGATFPEAFGSWAAGNQDPDVHAAAGALVVGITAGGPTADVLDGLAASLRDRLAVVAEARAQSAQARLSAIVVGGAPVAYLAFSALLDRRAIAALIATPIGRVCALAGVALEALGAWWMRSVLSAGARR